MKIIFVKFAQKIIVKFSVIVTLYMIAECKNALECIYENEIYC